MVKRIFTAGSRAEKIADPWFNKSPVLPEARQIGKASGIIWYELDSNMRRSRGWLQIENVPHGENRVSLFLPVEAKQPIQDLEETKSVLSPGGKESILLVEDDESVRLLIVSTLQKYGYDVLNAASAEEALEVWKRDSGKPELLLADLVLTGKVSGKELAEELERKNPALKVIYASGYSARVSAKLFKMKPGFAFVQKPFRPSKLAELVRKVLDSEQACT